MKRMILLLACLIGVVAQAQDRPQCRLKVQYETTSHSTNLIDGSLKTATRRYILQIADGLSYYYDPQTFYIDSLKNDPRSRDAYRKMLADVLHANHGTGNGLEALKKKGLTSGDAYKCQKDFAASTLTVWDSSFSDHRTYEVAMSDLTWEIGDSTRTVLDYECIQATADYHGRKWTAWFAPEIAVPEGPGNCAAFPASFWKPSPTMGCISLPSLACNRPRNLSNPSIRRTIATPPPVSASSR